jgi:hypothetical protein
MARDPWTDPDPQPGNFDEFLASVDPSDPRQVQANPLSPDARVTVLPAGMDEDDVKRLAALAAKRGKTIGEVLVELVREA